MSEIIPPPSSTTEYYRPIEVMIVQPTRPRYWLHAILLLGTLFTTMVVGARMEYNFQHNVANLSAGDEFIPFFPVEWVLAVPSRLLLGIPFSATLLFILLSHEMGHYLYCRRYRVDATLPFFIPVPTPIGTLGAVIRIKSAIRSRAALFDIGIAGPIAGFVVAVVALAAALGLSKPLPAGVAVPDLQLGYPLIFHVMQRVLGTVAPASSTARLPLSRMLLHPMAIAAWVGMLATALNLLPSGQLDGGHIVYAIWPRAHRYVSWITVFILIYMGQYYVGWRMWAGIIAVMNILAWRQRQAPDYPAIGGFRWGLAALALLMLILTLTPTPIYGNGLS